MPSFTNIANDIYQIMLGKDGHEPVEYGSPCYHDLLVEMVREFGLDNQEFVAFMREYMTVPRYKKVEQVIYAKKD